MSTDLVQFSQWVPSPTTTRGSSTKLGASPDGKTISFGSGRNAVIKSIVPGDEAKNQMFGHASNCTVAKITPTGYYCASGDSAGNVKVWDTTGNQSIKLESKPLAVIKDIAIDQESVRVVVVGEGRESFGATYNLSTGASIGEVAGHSKPVNSVALRPMRPFRAVTASDDFTTCVLNGVPFKFASQARRHARFVQSIDYAPDGSSFVSAGSDGKCFLYEGKEGGELGALVDPSLPGEVAHKGTIFQASYSKDSKYIATSSADQTVKLFQVDSGKLIKTWDFTGKESTALGSQQVGNVFAGSNLVALSFSGVINVLDIASDAPITTIHGHSQPITALIKTEAGYLSGDSAGCIRHFSSKGVCKPLKGVGHNGLVTSIVAVGTGYFSASFDDTVRSLTGDEFGTASIPTGSVPKGLAATSSAVFLATSTDLQIVSSSGQKIATVPVSYTPTALAVSPDGSIVAVGGEDSMVRFYKTDGKSLTEYGKAEGRNAVTALAFTHDGKKIAVGVNVGKVLIYDVATCELVLNRWSFQSARINSLVWSPSGSQLASASLDESIRVYFLDSPSKVLSGKNAHRGGVSCVVWENEETIVSAGQDGSIKTFQIKK